MTNDAKAIDDPVVPAPRPSTAAEIERLYAQWMADRTKAAARQGIHGEMAFERNSQAGIYLLIDAMKIIRLQRAALEALYPDQEVSA